MRVAIWSHYHRRYVEYDAPVSPDDGALRILRGAQPVAWGTAPLGEDRWTRRADGGWTRAREEHEALTVPPLEVPMTEVDPLHPSLPPKIAKAARRALDNGWTVRLTYAKGPRKKIDPVRYEQVATFALRCRKPKRWVIITWYQDGASWKPDGSYDAPWSPCTMTRALDALGE